MEQAMIKKQSTISFLESQLFLSFVKGESPLCPVRWGVACPGAHGLTVFPSLWFHLAHTTKRQAMGKADGICCLHIHSHSCALSAGMATGLHGSSKIVTSLGREIKLRLHLTFVGNKEARIMVLSNC